MRIRAVTETDCATLWGWANDPLVRAASLRSAPIPWSVHVAWFRRKMADPDCHMYVITDDDGADVGHVRFDASGEGTMEVGLAIAAGRRGRGLGTQALTLACDRVGSEARVSRIIAHIKPDNTASLRAFQRAGFLDDGEEMRDGQRTVRMCREAGTRVAAGPWPAAPSQEVDGR